MSCIDTLQSLLALASVLCEIEREEELLGRLPEKREVAKRRVASLEEQEAGARAAAAAAAREIRASDSAAAERDTSLKRYRSQLGAVASEREEAAMQAQIDRLQVEIDGLVEAGMAALEREEAATAKAAELEAQLREARASMAAEHARLDAQESQHREALDLARRELANRTAGLADDTARLWERLSKRYGAGALAPMTPEGACSGCDMSLLPHERDHVMSAFALACCSRCGRVLYDRERQEASNA